MSYPSKGNNSCYQLTIGLPKAINCYGNGVEIVPVKFNRVTRTLTLYKFGNTN
jgi:hypothetical protein